MWAIWWARRRAVNDSEFHSPLSTTCFVNRYMKDPKTYCLFRATFRLHCAKRVHIWIAPDGVAAKIDVDSGRSRQDNMGVSAAICRDKEGQRASVPAQDFNLRHMIMFDCIEVIPNINRGAATSYDLVLN